jgi:hypothetical protein
MKANQLATLVLRLLGIYCLIQVVPTITVLSSLVIVARTIEHSDNLIFTTFVQASIPAICWLAVAILLLKFSIPWGEKLASGISEETVASISFEQVQILAFAVVGVVLLAEGLSQLCGRVYSIINSMGRFDKVQYPSGMQFIDWHTLLSAFGFLLETALGAWMFFGARGFANFWRSMRNFGTPKLPENEKSLNRNSDSTI